MTDTHWSLRIITGMHAGAEIDLSVGAYTLGRHEDCDFILTDASLAEQQLEITIDHEEIALKSLCDHHLVIDNEDQGHTCNPTPHQIISTAGIQFAFGKAGEPWPDFTPSSNNVLATPPITSTHEEVASDAIHHPMQEENAQALDHLAEDAAEEDQNKRGWKKVFALKKYAHWPAVKTLFRTHRWIAILCGSLIGFILLLILFGWFWQKTMPDNATSRVNYLQVAKKIQANLQLPTVNIRRLADGRILLSGYIADNDIKHELLARLQKHEVPTTLRLTVMSDMRAEAIQVLNKNGYSNMHIELDTTPGSLVLSGYAPDAKYIAKIRDLLTSEVPGLLSIVEQVEYQSTREKALRTMLQEQGLGQQIKLLEQLGKITLRGRLGDISQGYRFRKVITHFREKYGQRPELIIDVTIPSTNIATLRPELDIKSISLGRTPYIILSNGEKYLPGAQLENGYILESIGLDYLVLRLGQKQIKYYVRPKDDG